MSKVLREQVIPAAKEAEFKISVDYNNSKDVAWNYLSKDVTVANMPRDRFVETFVALKSDCVALQLIHRELVLRAGPYQFDAHISEFEKKYRDMDDISSPEQQLEVVLDLYSCREKYMAKISKSLLEQQLGFDSVIKQSTTEPAMTCCSEELIQYLSLFRTFRKYFDDGFLTFFIYWIMMFVVFICTHCRVCGDPVTTGCHNQGS